MYKHARFLRKTSVLLVADLHAIYCRRYNYYLTDVGRVLHICVNTRHQHCQDSKVHGVNMGPTWVLSAPDGSHVGPMNPAIRVVQALACRPVGASLQFKPIWSYYQVGIWKKSKYNNCNTKEIEIETLCKWRPFCLVPAWYDTLYQQLMVLWSWYKRHATCTDCLKYEIWNGNDMPNSIVFCLGYPTVVTTNILPLIL